ncbi:phosphate ABC transporter substrate-binding protein PstS, partial [Xanthomonas perforans]|nr:phosphate ABC transporter substrate-binding protein PstS [Xanthomonas perforans]
MQWHHGGTSSSLRYRSCSVIHSFKTRLAVGVLAASLALCAQAADVTGAGASFIYPVMSKWSADYNAATKK